MSSKSIEKHITDCIHNTVYTRPPYPNMGNMYILAANLIVNEYPLDNDIDMIYKLAKVIEKYSTYDRELSRSDLFIITNIFRGMVRSYNKPSNILKCVKSLYKSTYEKNAFTKNKLYNILSEDNVYINIVDNEGRDFNIAKNVDGYSYVFSDYFEYKNK